MTPFYLPIIKISRVLTMNRKTTFSILIAAAMAVSCTSGTDRNGIRVIDADLTGLDVKEISLSEMNMLPLEYSEKSIVGGINGIVQTDDGGYIIASSASNTHRIMQFDKSGRYLRDIGHQGRGPGEFLDISSIFIISDTLYTSSFYGKNIVRYLIEDDGYEFLPPISCENLNWGISYIFATDDIPDRYFVKNTYNGTPGYTTPLFTVYDRNWNIVDTCRTKHPEGGFKSSFPISHTGDKVYLSQIFVDTIFVADNSGIYPAFRLDFGKSDYPKSIKYDGMKRFEYLQEHPDAQYLLHIASLINGEKAYLCLSSASSFYIMMYNLKKDESTFYRILDENGETASMLYMFTAADGKTKGIFTSSRLENPVICDLSVL